MHRQVEANQTGSTNGGCIARLHAQVRTADWMAALGNPSRGRCQTEWLVAQFVSGNQENVHAATNLLSPLLQRYLALGEIQRAGALQFGFAHERRTPFVSADGGENGADIGRITGSQLRTSLAQT